MGGGLWGVKNILKYLLLINAKGIIIFHIRYYLQLFTAIVNGIAQERIISYKVYESIYYC